MRNHRLSKDLIANAGVHFVAMELCLRGLVAVPTARNTRGIDILVYNPKSGATGALQVKASQDHRSFWPTPAPERCLNGNENAWAFVRTNKKPNNLKPFWR